MFPGTEAGCYEEEVPSSPGEFEGCCPGTPMLLAPASR